MAEDHAPPQRPSSLIAATAYHQGRRVADIGIDEGGEWARREGHVVWIGLLEPSDEELREVQRQFGLNDLAIEDAGQAHQRPKLQRYGDSLFVVARTAEIIGDRIEFGETHLFVGRGYRRLGPPRPVRLLQEGARPLRGLARLCSAAARPTSSIRSSTSSSTIIWPCSNACRRRPRRSRTTCSPSG